MPAAMRAPVTEVAVCIVESADGKILVAERTARQVAAGFWELPGGKIEPGESPAQAAARELQEETGLTPSGLRSWMQYEHQFPAKRLRLHFFRATSWQGTPQGREGQRLAWIRPEAPHVGPILASNDRALFALGLPPDYVVADFSARDDVERFLAVLRAELTRGARLIRVRVSALSPGQTGALLMRAAALADDHPGARLLSGSLMDARRAGLAGIHSCCRELRRLTSRPSAPVWAATCHDEADVARAAALGADFVVLSSIMADPAKPHHLPIGWDGLRHCAASYPVGIYAEGGLRPEDAASARQAGARGIVLDCASRKHQAATWHGAPRAHEMTRA